MCSQGAEHGHVRTEGALLRFLRVFQAEIAHQIGEEMFGRQVELVLRHRDQFDVTDEAVEVAAVGLLKKNKEFTYSLYVQVQTTTSSLL